MKNKKTKEVRQFNLPDGTQTTSVKKHVKEWESIYKPFCDYFGCRVVGYDPGILFSYNNQSFEMPTIIVREISEMIKNHKEYPLRNDK